MLRFVFSARGVTPSWDVPDAIIKVSDCAWTPEEIDADSEWFKKEYLDSTDAKCAAVDVSRAKDMPSSVDGEGSPSTATTTTPIATTRASVVALLQTRPVIVDDQPATTGNDDDGGVDTAVLDDFLDLVIRVLGLGITVFGLGCMVVSLGSTFIDLRMTGFGLGNAVLGVCITVFGPSVTVLGLRIAVIGVCIAVLGVAFPFVCLCISTLIGLDITELGVKKSFALGMCIAVLSLGIAVLGLGIAVLNLLGITVLGVCSKVLGVWIAVLGLSITVLKVCIVLLVLVRFVTTLYLARVFVRVRPYFLHRR